MFCIACGKELPENASFCLYCGQPLPSRGSTRVVGTQTKIAPGPTVEKFVGRFIRYVLGPILIVMVLLLLYAFLVLGPQQGNRQAGTASPISLLRPFSQRLMNESFEVPALSWKVWTVQVDQASVSPNLPR